MKLPKLTVGVVLYHGLHYLEHSIASLLAQQYDGELEFLFRDQSPGQEAKQHLEKIMPEVFPKKIKIETGDNRGHSGGHNCLMRQMTGKYYVAASNDMLYAPDAFALVIAALEQNPEYEVATAKSLVWDFAKNKKTKRFDSVGVGLTRSQYFFDIGQGEADYGQYDGRREIFGPSGALMFVSKQALSDIAYHIDTNEVEYYDEVLHYKNDIDFAYRLFWAGKKTMLVPEAHVWHDRQMGNGGTSANLLQRLKHRKTMPRWAKTSSFFGQLVILQKHVFGRGHSFAIVGIALGRLLFQFLFSLFTEPYVLTALFRFTRQQNAIQRKKIATIAQSPAIELERFFGNQVAFTELKKVTAATVVILDFFKGKKVVTNVKSLLKQQTDFALHIRVADNSCDSQNASLLLPLSKNQQVDVVINNANLGYPMGNNAGAAEASGEVIFVINPDIEAPDPKTLQKMADYLSANSDVAIVGPRQKNPDGSYEYTARRFPGIIAQIARRTALRQLSYFQKIIEKYENKSMNMNKTQDVEWLQSSFWAVRKDFWDYLGGFDEYYYVFMSDVEMCFQAWKMDMRVVYLPDIEVEADGIRSSAGSLSDFFKKRLVRVHMRDAIKYHWRHLLLRLPPVKGD